MAIKTINNLLGITSNGKKIEKEKDLKIYFNKKSHYIVFRFDPEFKSSECEFLFDDENHKLIVIEARKNSTDVRKLSKNNHSDYVVSYKKLFNIPSIPISGSLTAIRESVEIPGVSGKIIKVKAFTVDLNIKPEEEEVIFESNPVLT